MYSEKNNIFKTSDLALAAVILLYYPIQSINKSNPKRVIFIFTKDKNFDLYIERFYRGELSVNPFKYFQNLKLLKNRIYNS